jgi:uncharacterized protein
MLDISPRGGDMVIIMKAHQSHKEIIDRLKRAKGHLEKVIRMIEDKKACADVARQLHAVDHAIKNVKQIYIQDHIDHCLDEAVSAKVKNKKSKVSEFKEITKYL